MPICPLCMTTIHVGAKSRCPSCGYALPQAEEKFSARSLRLMPVVDEAGMLTLSELQKLTKALLAMERRIRPAVLSVHITNHESRESFSYYSHFLLNSALIYDPSFGARGAVNAAQKVKESEARKLEKQKLTRPKDGDVENFLESDGDVSIDEDASIARDDSSAAAWIRKSLKYADTSLMKPIWRRAVEALNARLKGLFSPTVADSVRQDFMLILVIDVQLEMACFSWGYMLDPYINPTKINDCIREASLDFREFDMAHAIMKVMRLAVSQITTDAGAVNYRLRMIKKRQKRAAAMARAARLSQWLIFALCAGLLLFSSRNISAQDAPLASVSPADILGRSESMMLFPSGKPSALALPSRGESLQVFTEDVQRAYLRPKHEGGFVVDPRFLLNTMEQSELDIFLELIAQKIPYQIYVAIFNRDDLIPDELEARALLVEHAPASEYALMIKFPLGHAAGISFALQGMESQAGESEACLQAMQQAAALYSAPLDAIKAAVRESLRSMETAHLSFKMLDAKSPLLHIDFTKELENDEMGTKEKLLLVLENEEYRLYYYIFGSLVLCLSGLFLFRAFWCYSTRLETSEADVRLASPYGAAVSEPVFYKKKFKAKVKHNIWID